jgi:hypothetical protein
MEHEITSVDFRCIISLVVLYAFQAGLFNFRATEEVDFCEPVPDGRIIDNGSIAHTAAAA